MTVTLGHQGERLTWSAPVNNQCSGQPTKLLIPPNGVEYPERILIARRSHLLFRLVALCKAIEVLIEVADFRPEMQHPCQPLELLPALQPRSAVIRQCLDGRLQHLQGDHRSIRYPIQLVQAPLQGHVS